MMERQAIYVLDANVLMEAHRRYYSLPICPGFWDCLLHFHAAGRVLSIDRIRSEISEGDELAEWVHKSVPRTFFASTQDEIVIANFGGMVAWTAEQSQFIQAAKDEFASVADGWLAAYAKGRANHVVVTMEEHAPNARRKVPLPNVCVQFGVPYKDTFSMLKELGGKFVFRDPVL